MKRLIKYIILPFPFLVSCVRYNANCNITIKEFLKENRNKVFGTKVDDGKVLEFRDKGRDSLVGGYYSFDSNGYLKSYQFFSNMKEYVYNEEYDKKGSLINVMGYPLVHNVARLTSDSSVNISMYFFTLKKSYKRINVITSDNRNFNLTPVKDTLYSNMLVSSFEFNNLKREQDIIAYFDVEYENECSKKIESFKDTITLHYTPLK